MHGVVDAWIWMASWDPNKKQNLDFLVIWLLLVGGLHACASWGQGFWIQGHKKKEKTPQRKRIWKALGSGLGAHTWSSLRKKTFVAKVSRVRNTRRGEREHTNDSYWWFLCQQHLIRVMSWWPLCRLSLIWLNCWRQHRELALVTACCPICWCSLSDEESGFELKPHGLALCGAWWSFVEKLACMLPIMLAQCVFLTTWCHLGHMFLNFSAPMLAYQVKRMLKHWHVAHCVGSLTLEIVTCGPLRGLSYTSSLSSLRRANLIGDLGWKCCFVCFSLNVNPKSNTKNMVSCFLLHLVSAVVVFVYFQCSMCVWCWPSLIFIGFGGHIQSKQKLAEASCVVICEAFKGIQSCVLM